MKLVAFTIFFAICVFKYSPLLGRNANNSPPPDTITSYWVKTECERLYEKGTYHLNLENKYLIPDTNSGGRSRSVKLPNGKKIFLVNVLFNLDSLPISLSLRNCSTRAMFLVFTGNIKGSFTIENLMFSRHPRLASGILLGCTIGAKTELYYSANEKPIFLFMTNRQSNSVNLTLPNNSILKMNNCRIDSGMFKLNYHDAELTNRIMDIVSISNCNFNVPINIYQDVDYLEFSLDTFSNLSLINTSINKKLSVYQSQFDNVFMKDGNFNEDGVNVNFHWDYLKGEKLGIGEDQDSIYKDKYRFSELLKLYEEFFNKYRNRGDLESANGCYAEMKLIETRRWEHLYQENKNFESFFRWQLNAFLSYFTDYGTNPAKAVIKSGWVILFFSIFYLFFPSDWDVSNRSQLLAKIKDIASKNREKSFLATVGFVAYSGLIHLLNALTLSLNAFTTLGFGDIPTHGAARYVTIVEGFIGWFLLTIFSVSLINQVLG